MRSPIRRIGVSKLATVSECLTPQGTHVALKLYDRQPLSPFQHDKIFAAAKRWQALASPSLMTYLDVLPDEKQVAMELMDRSASVRLSEGYSDPRLVSYVLRGVLTGLAYIHEQGLLHVNIKPSNVFFDEAGRAKLSDGLLVPASAPGTLPPPTNQKYLTPEHTSDSFGRMSFATDLYAAGFLFGYAKGQDHKVCGRLASIAAAEVISHIGARPQTPLEKLARQAGLPV